MKTAFVQFHEDVNAALKAIDEYPASHDEAKCMFGTTPEHAADLIYIHREASIALAEMEEAFGPWVCTITSYQGSL